MSISLSRRRHRVDRDGRRRYDAPPVAWREILWALRRLEALDLVRGGHFVTGVSGERFAVEATVPSRTSGGTRPRCADQRST